MHQSLVEELAPLHPTDLAGAELREHDSSGSEPPAPRHEARHVLQRAHPLDADDTHPSGPGGRPLAHAEAHGKSRRAASNRPR